MIWIPKGYEIEERITIQNCFVADNNWQIYSTNTGGYALVASESLLDRWDDMQLLPRKLFKDYTVEDSCYSILLSDSENLISSIDHGPYPRNYPQAYSFAVSLKLTRELIGQISLGDGLFVEKYSRVLPTFTACSDDDRVVLGRFLTGGVGISTDEYGELCRFVSWMRPDAIATIITAAGLQALDGNSLIAMAQKEDTKQEEPSQTERKYIIHKSTDRFELPGRPELEDFFNEHVVDIVFNAEKYKRMGIGFPSAIILHGAPGCGKTYAVERLAEFLGWPTYRIESGTIGSPYIHDTSKKIAEIFDSAIQNAPSMLIIDEMEAFLTDRGVTQASGQHHLEEVAEFLRRIPEASNKNVLVMAMTNMIDSIDPAVLRRGRFDHIIEVKMPTKEEVFSLLKKQLQKYPLCDDVDVDILADQLKGRALSDVTYVLREAARAAVKQERETINMELFLSACDSLPKKKEEKRRIGF